MKSLHMVMGIVIGVLLAENAQGAEKVFFEKDGIIVAEIESAPLARRWARETRFEGFTGESYYTDGGTNHVGAPPGGQATLTYKIAIFAPGSFQLDIHNRHEHPDHTLENDCWTKMNDGPRIKTYNSVAKRWNWGVTHEYGGGHHKPIYHLEPGMHVFEITGRSRGFSIDRFVLFRTTVEQARARNLSLSETTADIVCTGQKTSLESVDRLLSAGMLGQAIRAAQAELNSNEEARALEAKRVIDALHEFASNKRQEISDARADAPDVAVDTLLFLSRLYQGADIGKTLEDEAREWAQDPTTVAARQAKQILATVKASANRLEGKDLADQKVARQLAREVATIRRGCEIMNERFPDSRRTAEALEIARKLGIEISKD